MLEVTNIHTRLTNAGDSPSHSAYVLIVFCWDVCDRVTYDVTVGFQLGGKLPAIAWNSATDSQLL